MADTTTVKILDIKSPNAPKTFKEMKENVKSLRDELLQLEVGTDEYKAKLLELGNASHEITEITEQMRRTNQDLGSTLSNVGGVIGGITGGVQVLSGAASALGIEIGGSTEKTIKFLASLMSISQGIAAIDGGVKAFKAMKIALNGATIAQKGLNTAMKANPIMLLVTAATAAVAIIGNLISKEKELAKQREEEKKAQEEYNKQFEVTGRAYEDNIKKLVLLSTEWKTLEGNMNGKNKFLKEHKSDFEQLGIAVDSVTDAEKRLSEEGLQAYMSYMVGKELVDKLAAKLADEQIQATQKAMKTRQGLIDAQLTTARRRLEELKNDAYATDWEIEQVKKNIEELEKGNLAADPTKWVEEDLTKSPTYTMLQQAIIDLQAKAKAAGVTGGKAAKTTTKAIDATTAALERAKTALQDYMNGMLKGEDRYAMLGDEVEKLRQAQETLVAAGKQETEQWYINQLALEKNLKAMRDYEDGVKSTVQAIAELQLQLEQENGLYESQREGHQLELEQLRERYQEYENFVNAGFFETIGELVWKYYDDEKTALEQEAVNLEQQREAILAGMEAERERFYHKVELLDQEELSEEEHKQRLLELQLDFAQAMVDLDQDLADNETAIMENKYKKMKKSTEDWKNTMKSIYSAVGNAVSALGDVMEASANADGEVTEKEAKQIKNVKIASTVIDMLSGAVTAFASAMSLGPIAGPIVGGINAAAVLATGGANIANIRNTKISKDSDSAGAASYEASTNWNVAPEAQQYASNSPITTGLTDAIEQIGSASSTRVYVTTQDIDEAHNTRVQVDNNTEY